MAVSFCSGLQEVINKAIADTKYPTRWKIAKLKSSYKKGGKKFTENYRLLSMLSVPSKIFESIIGKRMDGHLKNSNLATKIQWGYMEGLSTASIVIYLTETWKKCLGEGFTIGVLFIDFRKAFDTVDYTILEKKLQAGGFYGDFNQLLMSYLTDITQYVEINGEKSSLRSMKIGVPQGSLLGPRLFALYVNDLPSTVSIGQIHMYADDTTAFCSEQIS